MVMESHAKVWLYILKNVSITEYLDIDECADKTHTCDNNAACSNYDGGYNCTCNDGFNGDGRASCNGLFIHR